MILEIIIEDVRFYRKGNDLWHVVDMHYYNQSVELDSEGCFRFFENTLAWNSQFDSTFQK